MLAICAQSDIVTAHATLTVDHYDMLASACPSLEVCLHLSTGVRWLQQCLNVKIGLLLLQC